MKFNFQFSNLCGSVYTSGNLVFSKDGDSIYTPVGNRITQFDLKNSKAETFPFENAKNIKRFAVSPNNHLMISVDEDGRCLLVNLYRKCVLHHFNFKEKVYDIRFSPNGKYFAVTHGNKLQVWHTPGTTREFSTFSLVREFPSQYDDAMVVDWCDNSRFVMVGSRDTSVRIFSLYPLPGYRFVTLTGHRSRIVGCYFDHQSLNVYSVSKDGALMVWECSRRMQDIDHMMKSHKETTNARDGEAPEQMETGINESDSDVQSGDDSDHNLDSDDENHQMILRHLSDLQVPKSHGPKGEMVAKDEDVDDDSSGSASEEDDHLPVKRRSTNLLIWTKKDKHLFNPEWSYVTCTAYHKETHLMVVGFKTGVFSLYEMPDFNQIHSLSLSQKDISSVSINSTGEWLAFGCGSFGQLVVWEWRSETYVLRQQGHHYDMNTLAYSPDGVTIATGGDDGKVKLWNTSSSLCIVTFAEHTSGVTMVTFTSSGHVILSASLDGTVRAYDLNRYRCFRTLTSPRPVQFSCVAADEFGDIVCAGSKDTFEIFVWAMKTGRMTDLLAGHEGPVSAISFSSTKSQLASCSWDKTLRFWDVFSEKGGVETVQMTSEALTMAYSPGGTCVAVSTLDGKILLFDVQTATQIGCVEGRPHLQAGRHVDDKVTAQQLSSTVSFNSLCFTADGEYILAGGRSKFVCLYRCADQILVKRFQLSKNKSFSGMKKFLHGKNMSEAGPLDLISDDEEDDSHHLKLPGVTKGEFSSRRTMPEMRVRSLQFSPTGHSWAAACTEGMLVYSLNATLLFDPHDITTEVTPEAVETALAGGDHLTALVLSFKLGDVALTQRTLEAVPTNNVPLVIARLPNHYIERLIHFLAEALLTSAHFQFYLHWCKELMMEKGPWLKENALKMGVALRDLEKSVISVRKDIGKLTEENTNMLAFLTAF